LRINPWKAKKDRPGIFGASWRLKDNHLIITNVGRHGVTSSYYELPSKQKLSPPGAMGLPTDKTGANLPVMRFTGRFADDNPFTGTALRDSITAEFSLETPRGPGPCLALPAHLRVHELPRAVVGAGREESFDFDRNKRRKEFKP
jgi:hypothetical protein